MHLIWNKLIRTSAPWEPEYFGLFSKQKEGISFFFQEKNNLFSISEKDSAPRLRYSDILGQALPLPQGWVIVENQDTSFLVLSERKCFDMKNNVFFGHIPTEVQEAYSKHARPEKYYVEAPHFLGEYTITHKGNCGYICKKDDFKLWEFTGKAYLHTDIMRWRNRVFFGTAGYGGYFYILDIDTGEALVSMKTGGTRCFAQDDGLCYVMSNTKNAKLLCIDISSGKMVSQCDLPGIATVNSRVAIVDHHLHAITYDYSRSELKGAIWCCAEM